MFGLKFIKFDSMTYVVLYKNGLIVKEGRGLSFFYFAPNSSIVAVPMGTSDIQFIFSDTTTDFQSITVQGQITYQIREPKQLAALLDFSVDDSGRYKKNDHEKLHQRIINEAQTATSAYLRGLQLKQALRSAKEIEQQIMEGLAVSKAVTLLGIEPLSVNVLAVKPTPETARALEAEQREALQQDADQAIYERRNFAVEQERKIRESELNTEIAVEEKKKQIAEKKIQSEVQAEESSRRLRLMKIDADIAVEEQQKALTDLKVENEKKQADALGYRLEATLNPYKGLDWRTILAMSKGANDPAMHIALAFREMGENAQKIGTLNITPDLLESVMNNKKNK